MDPHAIRSIRCCLRRAGLAAAIVGLGAPAAASTNVILTAGTTGIIVNGQGFNGTRGIDVTVLSDSDLQVSTLVLRKFSMGTASSVLIGARIYESGSGLLVGAGDATFTSVGGVIPVPVTATLVSGVSYRLSFYVETTPAGQGTCTLFDPDPVGAGGFPYDEPEGLLQMNGTFEVATDSFPSGAPLDAEPHVSVLVTPAALDLATGTSGSLAGAAFNGTRGLDVTVVGPENVHVESLTLTGLGAASSALVGARLYESGGTLVASADTTIGGAGGPITVPVAATLMAGAGYRVAFFVATTPPGQGTGSLFDPLPVGAGGFPYTETGDVLQVNAAYSSAADAFPASAENGGPQIQVNTAIGQWLDLGQALAGGAGTPHLVGVGSLVEGTAVTTVVSRLLPNDAATLVIGVSAIQAPFKGGVLVPDPDILLPGLATDGLGVLSLPAAWPAGLPSGFTFFQQCWQKDPAGASGFSASNGVSGTAP